MQSMALNYYATDDDLVIRQNTDTSEIAILRKDGTWYPRPTNLALVNTIDEATAQALAGPHSLTAAVVQLATA